MNDTTFSGNGKVSFIPVITNATTQPQTNADKIRAMDDAELTRFFAENCGCGDWCMHNRSGACARKDEYSCCLDVWHDWLKSPVEVDNG